VFAAAGCFKDSTEDTSILHGASAVDDPTCGDLVVAVEDGDGGLTAEDGGALDLGGTCAIEAGTESSSNVADPGAGLGTARQAVTAAAAADAGACWRWDTATGHGMDGAFSAQCSLRLGGPRGGPRVAYGPSRHVIYGRICGRTCNPDRTNECYPSRRAICEKCARLAGGLGDTDSMATFSTSGYQWCQALEDPNTCYWSVTSGSDPATFDNMDSWCWIRDPATR
jgi:hypothetical protein